MAGHFAERALGRMTSIAMTRSTSCVRYVP
jgi:hypothetical protein